MVGALPSNRCETCRDRKVKCDGDWPVCGPCQRGNRVCPPRPSLKIIDDGVKFRKILMRSKGGATRRHKREFTSSDNDSLRRWDHVRPPVSMSAAEILSGRFIATLQIEDPAFCLRVLGDFIFQIPQLLGHCQAIDAATLCVIASYEHFLRGSDPSGRINPHLYGHALQSLQRALNDPEEWHSLGTLCSAILLHRLEALFGNLRKNGIKVHASGIAALLQKRGPPQKGNAMEIQLTMDSHISIIQYSVTERKDCFLASDEWASALDMRGPTPDLKRIYFRLMRSMALWPTLVRANSMLSLGGATIEPVVLSQKAYEVWGELQQINQELNKLIYGQGLLRKIPSRRLNDSLPTMFEVRETMAAMAVCHYAIFSIVVCRILASLSTTTPKEKLGLESDILKQCHRVWMLIEHSRLNKPLGLPAMQAALIFTYESAHENAKQNILETLNDLDSFRKKEDELWEEDEVLYIARSLLG